MVDYVASLLADNRLRLQDCESHAMVAAFRDAVEAESSNDVAVALLYLKLGGVQREIAEGNRYALDRAVETHRRAHALFAQALDVSHHATLKARHALARALIANDDLPAARTELQGIVDLRTTTPAFVIQDDRHSVLQATAIVAHLLGLPVDPPFEGSLPPADLLATLSQD